METNIIAQVKLDCLKIAANNVGSSTEDILKEAKKLAEWVLGELANH